MDPISIATAAFGAIKSGIEVGKEARNFGEGISKESLKTMFKQDAKSILEMAKKKENE